MNEPVSDEEKLNILRSLDACCYPLPLCCHIKPTSPYLCLTSNHVDQSLNLDCLTRHWPTCEDYLPPLPLSFVLSVSCEEDQWWWYNGLEFWVGIELSYYLLNISEASLADWIVLTNIDRFYDTYLLTLVFEFHDMIMWTWQQIICNCIDYCNLKICNIS